MATLNTRLKLKYDSYEHWSAEANQFKLLEGEVAFCYIPDAVDPVRNAPTLMYKVGDGTKTFNQLSWGSALAADVYNWAKAQYAPVASLAGTDGVVVTKTAANAHTAKANLKDYTKSANAATKAAANANRTYAVELDKDGHLAVVVPWSDNNTNTAHSHAAGIGLKVDGDGGVSGTTTYKAALASETKNTAKAGTGKLYAVEADADGNLAVNVPWTDNDTKSFTISATASDDDVVVLTGTAGTNGVSYDAKHAKKGPASGYISGSAAAEIKGSAGTGTIKVPHITVDAYGHVTAAEDKDVTITLPTVSKSAVGLDKVVNAAQDTTPTKDSTNYVTSGGVKSYVDSAISGVTQFDIVKKESFAELPATGKKGTIYIVPHEHGTSDVYDEYIWNTAVTPNDYEKIGNTDVNLDGYVPTSRKINNKALTADITLGAADVGVNETAFPGLKKTGTVTSVATGDGLTGGSITSSGTVSHAVPTGAAVKASGFYKIATDKFGHVTGTTAVAIADITGLGIPGADTNQKITAANASGTNVTFGNDDTVAIKAGTNVQVVADQSAKTITISSTNTQPNNAKLKDGTGVEIFSANASTDVQLLVIDCGSATTCVYDV